MTPVAPPPDRERLIERYQHLTKVVMPKMGKTTRTNWPVVNDHCFQRIILDNICGGVWYDQIERPAYRHLTVQQAVDAVHLCEQIIAGDVSLSDLNRRSLAWRGKARSPSKAVI